MALAVHLECSGCDPERERFCHYHQGWADGWDQRDEEDEGPVAGLTTADPLAPATLRDHAESRPTPLGPEDAGRLS